MRRHFVGFCLTLLAAVVPSHSYAVRSPMGGTFCEPQDLESEENIAACFSAGRGNYRQRAIDPGATRQQQGADCAQAGDQLARIFRQLGGSVPATDMNSALPSCEVIAGALQRVNGNPPVWARCAAYPGRFEASHMKACLQDFLPRYTGGLMNIEALRGCGDAINQYEKALALAVTIGDRRAGQRLPPGYERPQCGQLEQAGIIAATAVAQTAPVTQAPASTTPEASADADRPVPPSTAPDAVPPAVQPVQPLQPPEPCRGWIPGVGSDHVEACLAPNEGRLLNCEAARSEYTARVRQRNGGLPAGFFAPPCGHFDSFTKQAKAIADQRWEASRLEREQADRDRKRRQQDSENLGVAIWKLIYLPALLLHTAIGVGFTFYQISRLRSGQASRLPQKGYFEKSVTARHMLAQIGATIAIFYTSPATFPNMFYPWMWAAILATIIVIFFWACMKSAGYLRSNPAPSIPTPGPVGGDGPIFWEENPHVGPKKRNK